MISLARTALVTSLGLALLLLVTAPNWLEGVPLGPKLGVLGAAVAVLAAGVARAGALARALGRRPGLRRALSLYLAALATAALTSVPAELYLARVHGLDYYPEARRYFRGMVDDEILQYRHPAHLDERFQGARVRTNGRGFRDDALLARKPSGERRLLSLGDSVAFGWGVEEGDTYAEVLEGLLAGAGGALRWEVVNTGTGSYNTVQQANLLLSEGARLEPDAVVLLFVDNDTDNHVKGVAPISPVRAQRFAPEPVARPLSWRSAGLSGWRDLMKLRAPDFALLHVPRFLALLRDAAADSGPPEEPPGLGLACSHPDVARQVIHPNHHGLSDALNALDVIGRFARENALPLLVFLDAAPQRWPFFRRLACHLERMDLPFVQLPGVEHLRNSPVDSHPDAAGHRLLAEQMAARLRPLLERTAPRDPGRPLRIPGQDRPGRVLTVDFAGDLEALRVAGGEATRTASGLRLAASPGGDEVRVQVRFPAVDLAALVGGRRVALELDLGDARGVEAVGLRLGSESLAGELRAGNATEYVWARVPGWSRDPALRLRRRLAEGEPLGGIHAWRETRWLEVFLRARGPGGFRDLELRRVRIGAFYE